MKKTFVLIALMFLSAICSNIFAQQTPPPGAGDKSLGDKNIKTRSIELERVERDSKNAKTSPANAATTVAEDRLALKYPEIKTDFEQIQNSQDVIIKTYQKTGKIDYAQIGKSALEINQSATRLSANLFPQPITEEVGQKNEAKKSEKPEKSENDEKVAKSKSLRDLIVELDNNIGAFATSPMFQNLRVVDAAVSTKAKTELEKIIEISRALNAEAQKMNGEK